MTFFEPPVPHEPDDTDPFPELAHGNFVPGVVAVERVLAQNDNAIVVLTAVAAFPDGLELHVLTHDRNDDNQLHGGAVISATVVVASSADSLPRPRPHLLPPAWDVDEPTHDAAHSFQFGVRFEDGGYVTNQWGHGSLPTDGPPQRALEGGDAGTRAHARTFFLWPLPVRPFTIVTAWPALELSQTETLLDVAEVVHAAQRAQPAFLEDDGKPSHQRLSLMFWNHRDLL